MIITYIYESIYKIKNNWAYVRQKSKKNMIPEIVKTTICLKKNGIRGARIFLKKILDKYKRIFPFPYKYTEKYPPNLQSLDKLEKIFLHLECDEELL